MPEASEILSAGLEKLGLKVMPGQQQRLLDFIALLEKWNRHFNLTALHGAEEMVVHHLLDSLSILPFIDVETHPGGEPIRSQSLLDVGSGAGLPGIPLAIGKPEWNVVLLDSNGKKTRFMQQAVYDLGIGNVEVIKARIEEYRPQRSFDTVVSRAFSGLAGFVQSCQQVCGPATRLYAMKGRYPQAELEALHEIGYSAETQKLHVPGLAAERHLISLRKDKER